MSVRIITGDCRTVLASLPAESVHCCVTSPPYWGLRDYGVDGQIGLEASIDAWVDELVAVFREVRRVLRDDGTLWLNLGDSYAGSGRGGDSGTSTIHSPQPGHSRTADEVSASQRLHGTTATGARGATGGLKPKDLIGQPWLAAFALRADGWYLRQEIIWNKPNPMPESIRDRCTKAHEQIFLLSKSPRYYYDFEAMQEPSSPGTHARMAQDIANQKGSTRAHGGVEADRPFKAGGRRPGNVHPPKGQAAYEAGDESHRTKGGLLAYSERKLAAAGSGNKNNDSFDEAMAVMPDTRNKRSVWTVPSHPFKEAHFATFPPDLIEPCILAGCPPGGVVLDPFGGAGTTGLVADRKQRDALLIELNPVYAAMASSRIRGDAPLFAETTT